jgi:DNA-binding response OmpR family regulator
MPGTILIATNDPHITYLLQRYTEESGFHAVNTSRGADVLNLAQQMKPALVIMETRLPGAASRDVVLCLKAEPSTRDIPIVIFSFSDDNVSDEVEGVAGYLHDSVMYDDFVRVLRNAGVLPQDASLEGSE